MLSVEFELVLIFQFSQGMLKEIKRKEELKALFIDFKLIANRDSEKLSAWHLQNILWI